MELNVLTAITPIDGRYRKTTESIAKYFSEFGLIKYRVLVEIEYFITLSEFGLPQLPELAISDKIALKNIYNNFTLSDAAKIKETEKITNHDVKAVEYFIKEKLQEIGLEKYAEFVHFGLTSQDINNTSIPLLLKHATIQELIPTLNNIIDKITELSKEWVEVPLLAKTHGQPASPDRKSVV